MLVGHQHLVRDFKQLVKHDKLSHGYIFFGEPEVGKFYFAKHLANFLENGEFEISKRLLQDALVLENAGGIEEMRELKSFLWQKPVISAKRTVIINDAENLTPQAQNAILKVTEEPPPSALLIIIAANPENLIPPLASRMQKIYFGRLSNKEMDNTEAFGRPGRAMRLLSDPLAKEAERYASEFVRLRDFERSLMIKDLVEAQKEKPKLFDLFFEALIIKLRNDSLKNLNFLKSALHRLFLIKSYNTSKRLQLEAIA